MKEKYKKEYFDKGRDIGLSTVMRHHHGAMAVIKRILGETKKGNLLDVGCGTGAFSVALLEISSVVIGIDVSKYAIETAQKRYKNIGNVNFLKVNLAAGRLPFKDADFDAIVCLHVLEHIRPDKLPGVLDDLRRLLKIGGILIAAVPNCGFSYRRNLLRDKSFGRGDPTHKSFFTTKSLDNLLREKFRSPEIFTYPPPGLWAISESLSRRLSFNFGNNIYGICRK
jgi:ubiquinone/menaquinone biosynthesis C-methylase UbiE